ncbi:MAG: histidine kinase [Niabella sp.]
MYTTENSIFFTALLTSISLGAIFIFLGIVVFRTQRRYFIKRQQVCTEELEGLKNERLRIARDLHDELGPLLHMVYRQVESLADNRGNLQELASAAKDTLKIITGRISEISKNMDDQRIIKAGLKRSIEQFISQYNLAIQLYFQFRYRLTREPSPLVTISLYRILLELVNNTIRHSRASVAFITFKQKNNMLYFHYADNGNGLNPDQLQDSEGHGLKNLQHRVSLLGGLLESHFEEGPSFLIRIPLP